MDLILWRHAEAFDARLGERDLDRTLTPEGERQAQQMGQWLARHLTDDTRVLVSPARRAQQTAQALHRPFSTEPAIAPGAGAQTLLAAAGWPDAPHPVLVVGHQPTLGLSAAYLMSGVDRIWTVRPAGVWWLRGRQVDARLEVMLVTARAPDGV